MKARNIIITISALCLPVLSLAGTRGDMLSGPTAKCDTVSIYDDEEEADNDSIGKTHQNKAKEFNALKYIMEHRYRNYGDQFTHKWDDHLFLELGAGMSQDVAKFNKYTLSTLTNVHVGIGKQFSRAHTARLTLGGDFGYLKRAGTNYARFNGKIDWLYNVTTYLEGYNPARLIDLSTMLGIGARYLIAPSGTTEKKLNPEMHVGLQFKFFTGPQGYFALEPYAGIGSGKVSKKYNSFYGVDLNLIYYIHNNLSPEQRLRYMKDRPEGTEGLVPPSTWRTPWFVEMGGGVAMASGGELSTSETLGHKATFSVGRWLSPVIGLRTNLSLATTTWRKDDTQTLTFKGATGKADITYPMNLHNQNMDWQVEALFNPFGFSKNYNWDAPFGADIVLGGGIGWNVKHQLGTKLKVHASSFTAGLHLWARLADDLQFFVEPRYTRYNYRVPYGGSTWAKRYEDTHIHINIGLTTLLRSKHFREEVQVYEPSTLPLSVGIGGGSSLMHSQQAFAGRSLSYTGSAFGEYHLGEIHSARVCFEFLSVAGLGTMPIRISDGFGNEFKEEKSAMFEHRYNLGLVSLNYMANMTNLLSGYKANRKFEFEMFAGPALLIPLSCKSSLKTDNILYDSQTCEYDEVKKPTLKFALNAGGKLKYNATNHIAVTLTPQVYGLFSAPNLEGIAINKFRMIETLDLGIQYNF